MNGLDFAKSSPLTILVGTQWPWILYMGLCVCAKTGFLEFRITVFVISLSAISLSNQIIGVWYLYIYWVQVILGVTFNCSFLFFG